MGYYPRLALLRQVTNRYNNEEALFEFVIRRGIIVPSHIRRLLHISKLVTKEFEGIFRETRDQSGDREPYVTHLYAVCAIIPVYLGIWDWELLAAALLHDIKEEFPKDWPKKRIVECSTPRTAYLVDTVSIDRNLHYYSDEAERERMYFRRISKKVDSAVLKLCDRSHNQLTLAACSRERQIRKNRETLVFVDPITVKYNILVWETRESIQETDERLGIITVP